MAVLKRGPVLRVTGLSASQPDEELTTSLKAAIDENLMKEERPKVDIKVAVVPSCYTDGERVALVECCGGLPEFLSDLVADPLGNWQMEMGDMDINFDQNFFGFTQLYAPQPDLPVVADIIAITDLDGHAYDSWRGKGNLGRMWLRDFLSKDLPCCRTMIYGYNSKLSIQGVDTILDYSRGLSEELKKTRNTEELRQRPLFFIAYSFGGIILAHCLIKAVQTMEDDHPTIATLHKATYGMLLFGIPHRGLVIDDIQNMLAKQDNHPRIDLLNQIKQKSENLIMQLDDFKNFIRDRKVVSFYEMAQTRQLQFDSESKRWMRTGNFITAVDRESALLQLPDTVEDKIPLDTDHSMIVKFDSRNTPGYSSAREKLSQFTKDAPGVVASRFARTQNKPKSSNMVPFQRNIAFVGREDILAKIDAKIRQTASLTHSRVALVGLGGVGKSQIAIEYAYRARDSAPYMWVFWVHASTTARFEQAYGDIADKVGLQGREDPKTNILQLVHNWLRDEMNGRWLMIVDNADDDQVFASPHANNNSNGAHSAQRAVVSLAKFLPQASNGWILVTSRDLAAAMNLVGGKHNVIHIDPMDEHDALTLLKSKMRVDESSEEDAKALVETLEGIPLAITHAAAYITANEPIISVSTYLKLFSESEENQASLLDSEDARDLRRDPGVSDAVITTWQLSFEQIRKTKPEAADLLSLMTMFDRQGIPEYLIYDGKTQLQFTEAVGPLFRFSLIRTQARKEPDHQVGVQLLDMHSLVHLATRAWVKRRGQINMWQKAALRILAATFPDGRPETWAACQILLPHSMKVLGYSVENAHQARLDRAKFASNTAWYLMQMGEYAEAGRFVRSAVKTRKEVLGLEHQDTLTSVGYFGLLLLKQGKYEEAELMLQRALQRREKVLGPEHQDTLRGIQDLGAALKKQGKYKEAEAMHQRALQGQEKVLGPGHVDTLYTVINLGGVLESQGKYKEAEAMHQRALQGCKNMFGLEHPITLSAMASLASTLWNQGQLVNAKKLQIQVLEGYKRVLGDNHPDTLTTMGSLASTLKSQGQLVDAMDLQTQVLDAGRRVLGDNHPDTLLAMDNLAHTLRSQGRNQVALSLTEVCVEGRERVLGLDYINNKSSTAWLNDWRSEDLSSEDLSSEE